MKPQILFLPLKASNAYCYQDKSISLIAINSNLPKRRRGFYVRWGVEKINQMKSREFYKTRDYWRKKSKKRREMSRLAFRARQMKCPVIIPFTKAEIIKRDGLNCYLCGIELSEKHVTIDHLIPLLKGGFHCPSNARIACLKCNQEKGSKYGS